MTAEMAKTWLLKKTDFNLIQDDDKNLEIPKDVDGNDFLPENLGSDRKQVFYHVFKTLKEWIEYKKEELRKKELGEMYQPSTLFQPLFLTLAGGGGPEKSTLVKTIIAVMKKSFNAMRWHWWDHQLALNHSMVEEQLYTDCLVFFQTVLVK